MWNWALSSIFLIQMQKRRFLPLSSLLLSPSFLFFLSLKGKDDSIKCLRLFRWYWLAGFIHCIGTNQDCKMTLFLLLFAQRFASEKLVWTCQLTFFFNNLHCLDEMQRQFLEVVQEPRTCPSLTKCWEPPKPPGTSSLSSLSEIPLQGRTTVWKTGLRTSKLKAALGIHLEGNQQLLSTGRNPEPDCLPWWGRQMICWGWEIVLPEMVKHLWSY